MRLRLLFAAVMACAAMSWAQPAYFVPREMRPLQLLEGRWHTSGGSVEFRFESRNTIMTERIKEDKSDAFWHIIMQIRLDHGQVLADLLDARPIHYQLVSSAGERLAFADDADPRHKLTFTKAPADKLLYLFQTGDKVTKRGILNRSSHLYPLSE